MTERWRGGALAARADALREGDYEAGRTPEEPNRRSLLLAAMNGTSLVLASGMVLKAANDRGGTHTRRALPVQSRAENTFFSVHEGAPAVAQSWKDRPLPVPSSFVGKRVPDMEWGYYAPLPEVGGVSVSQNALPDMLPPVAFHENLAELYTRKSELIGGAADEDEQLQLYHRLSREYRALFEKDETRRMDLSEFRSLIEHENYAMLNTLAPSYSAIVKTYLLPHAKERIKKGTPEQDAQYEKSLANVLEYLAKHITPDMMLAYIATELFPAPERSMDALEFLTKNAGVEFIERIPALGDKLESTGIFQLTKMVCGPGGSVNNLVGVMKQKGIVPAELKDFASIEDHLHAGFLFAFHNVLALVQDLVKDEKYEELTALLESVSTGSAHGNSTVFLEYLAGAHHRPTVAREIVGTWLARNKALARSERSTTLRDCCGDTRPEKQVGVYMEKSRQSFLHLLRRPSGSRAR